MTALTTRPWFVRLWYTPQLYRKYRRIGLDRGSSLRLIWWLLRWKRYSWLAKTSRAALLIAFIFMASTAQMCRPDEQPTESARCASLADRYDTNEAIWSDLNPDNPRWQELETSLSDMIREGRGMGCEYFMVRMP